MRRQKRSNNKNNLNSQKIVICWKFVNPDIMPRPDITTILKANPQRKYFNDAREKSKRLSMHITGKNFKELITQMEEFETDQKKNLRQSYSRSNRDIFARIHRPKTKVFTATGGSTDLSMTSESKRKEFTAYIQSIRKGMSLRKWVQNIAMKAFEVDPCGVFLMEINANGQAYPTYKSTNDIFYYEAEGRQVNYIILRLTKREIESYALAAPGNGSEILDRMKNVQATAARYFRVIDEVSDKVIEYDGDTATEIPQLSLPNMFMQCPAIIISDIFQFDSDELLSPDDEIVELANSILTQNSVFEIWKNLHMFPRHWRAQSVCPNCAGQGVYDGKICTACNGTKFQKKASVRDELVVPLMKDDNGKVSMPTQFDGYSAPPTDAWELSVSDIDRLESQMFKTHWGYMPETKAQVTVSGDKKTATQVLDESANKTERLYDFSSWAESIERFVVNMAGMVMYGTAYKGCSINYGDRYVTESPDAIWLKYAAARKDGAPQAVLDSLLQDYYEAKNYGNPVLLEVSMKQMRVEPWVHISIMDAQRLAASTLDKACKIYFSEWASTLTVMDWVANKEEDLRALLVVYVTPKVEIIKQEVADAALEAEFGAQAKPGLPAQKPTPA